MYALKKAYIDRLNKAASEGEDQLLYMLKKRLIEKDGPYLFEGELTHLDIVYPAFYAAGDFQQTYFKAFLSIIQDFNRLWTSEKTVKRADSTLLSYALSFLRRKLPDRKNNPIINTFLAGVIFEEVLFIKKVPDTFHGYWDHPMPQIREIALEQFKDSKYLIQLLLPGWYETDRFNELSVESKGNALIAMVNTDCRRITFEMLLHFFNEAQDLDHEERNRVLGGVFFSTGHQYG